MKTQVRQIVGKTIQSVILLEAPVEPRWQVMLVFDDETHYEFYGPQINTTAGLNQGGVEEVLRYAKSRKAEVRFQA
jgi:hypothetical protein